MHTYARESPNGWGEYVQGDQSPAFNLRRYIDGSSIPVAQSIKTNDKPCAYPVYSSLLTCFGRGIPMTSSSYLVLVLRKRGSIADHLLCMKYGLETRTFLRI